MRHTLRAWRSTSTAPSEHAHQTEARRRVAVATAPPGTGLLVDHALAHPAGEHARPRTLSRISRDLVRVRPLALGEETTTPNGSDSRWHSVCVGRPAWPRTLHGVQRVRHATRRGKSRPVARGRDQRFRRAAAESRIHRDLALGPGGEVHRACPDGTEITSRSRDEVAR